MIQVETQFCPQGYIQFNIVLREQPSRSQVFARSSTVDRILRFPVSVR